MTLEQLLEKMPDFKAIKRNGGYRAWLCGHENMICAGDTLLECLKKLL